MNARDLTPTQMTIWAERTLATAKARRRGTAAEIETLVDFVGELAERLGRPQPSTTEQANRADEALQHLIGAATAFVYDVTDLTTAVYPAPVHAVTVAKRPWNGLWAIWASGSFWYADTGQWRYVPAPGPGGKFDTLTQALTQMPAAVAALGGDPAPFAHMNPQPKELAP